MRTRATSLCSSGRAVAKTSSCFSECEFLLEMWSCVLGFITHCFKQPRGRGRTFTSHHAYSESSLLSFVFSTSFLPLVFLLFLIALPRQFPSLKRRIQRNRVEEKSRNKEEKGRKESRPLVNTKKDNERLGRHKIKPYRTPFSFWGKFQIFFETEPPLFVC